RSLDHDRSGDEGDDRDDRHARTRTHRHGDIHVRRRAIVQPFDSGAGARQRSALLRHALLATRADAAQRNAVRAATEVSSLPDDRQRWNADGLFVCVERRGSPGERAGEDRRRADAAWLDTKSVKSWVEYAVRGDDEGVASARRQWACSADAASATL